MFSNIPDLCPLRRVTSVPSSCKSQKCLLTLLNVSLEGGMESKFVPKLPPLWESLQQRVSRRGLLCLKLRCRKKTFSLSYFKGKKKSTCVPLFVFSIPPPWLYNWWKSLQVLVQCQTVAYVVASEFLLLVFTGILVGIWEKLCQALLYSHYFMPFSFVVNFLTLCTFILKLF